MVLLPQVLDDSTLGAYSFQGWWTEQRLLSISGTGIASRPFHPEARGPGAFGDWTAATGELPMPALGPIRGLRQDTDLEDMPYYSPIQLLVISDSLALLQGMWHCRSGQYSHMGTDYYTGLPVVVFDVLYRYVSVVHVLRWNGAPVIPSTFTVLGDSLADYPHTPVPPTPMALARVIGNASSLVGIGADLWAVRDPGYASDQGALYQLFPLTLSGDSVTVGVGTPIEGLSIGAVDGLSQPRGASYAYQVLDTDTLMLSMHWMRNGSLITVSSWGHSSGSRLINTPVLVRDDLCLWIGGDLTSVGTDWYLYRFDGAALRRDALYTSHFGCGSDYTPPVVPESQLPYGGVLPLLRGHNTTYSGGDVEQACLAVTDATAPLTWLYQWSVVAQFGIGSIAS
jgi:hypothetical protein